jgi:hypothetical protein
MLAVGPQTLEGLWEGLARALRHHEYARLPSLELLDAYLRSQPAYRMEGDVVRLAVPTTAGLTGSDRAMLKAFRRHEADELPVSALYAALREEGYGERGAAHLVQICPVLRRVGYGVYSWRV